LDRAGSKKAAIGAATSSLTNVLEITLRHFKASNDLGWRPCGSPELEQAHLAANRRKPPGRSGLS